MNFGNDSDTQTNHCTCSILTVMNVILHSKFSGKFYSFKNKKTFFHNKSAFK